jgi:hypothetical protein
MTATTARSRVPANPLKQTKKIYTTERGETRRIDLGGGDAFAGVCKKKVEYSVSGVGGESKRTSTCIHIYLSYLGTVL